jgi:hypothetical protein
VPPNRHVDLIRHNLASRDGGVDRAEGSTVASPGPSARQVADYVLDDIVFEQADGRSLEIEDRL